MPTNPPTRVLCVDDDADAGEMLSLLLKPYGIEVSQSQSAAEAWLKIEVEKFNLFMLDAWLPELDGFEFCRQLRELDGTTPILFYSGAAYEADIRKGIAAGANAYVVKPNIDSMRKTLLALIAKAQTPVVAPQWLGEPRHSTERALSPQFFTLETTLG